MGKPNTNRKRAVNTRYQANRKARLKAKGLCQFCGIRPAMPSIRSSTGIGCRCASCAKVAAKASREYLARRRPAWRRLGICILCGTRKRMPNDTRCGVCAEAQSDLKSRAVQARHEEGAMKLHWIHEGGYYQGPSGQVRRIIRHTKEMVVFEVVDRGRLNPNNTSTPALGEQRRVLASSLAAWAIKEIPAPMKEAAS